MYLTVQKYQQTAEKISQLKEKYMYMVCARGTVDMPSLDQLLFAQYY